MKRFLPIFFFTLSFIAGKAQSIQDIIKARPNPPRLVNDYAHVLTADQVQALETKLIHYDDSTSTQIAIVTVKTLDGFPIEEAALNIIRNWGVGNKKTNNGIVILAAIDDRKIRIETGYGLEGAIPDITGRQIIDQFIAANFREENYYRGFDQAANALIKAAAGEYKAPENYRNRAKEKSVTRIVKVIIVIIVILVFVIGGSGGRGGGGFMSRRGYRGVGGSPIWWLPTGGGWGSGGSSGGGWGSGGGWSGGSGGFGGFGGGSGGGGGASGSW